MLYHALFYLTLTAALGSGLMAGLFCSFSNFVMKALAALPPDKGAGAMQSINATILNPLFLTVFIGTALLSVAIAILAGMQWPHAGTGWIVAGAVLYIVGGFVITAACNVPMNEALAAVDPGTTEGAAYWQKYLSRWTAWNHVRSVATLASTAALIYGLSRLREAAAEVSPV